MPLLWPDLLPILHALQKVADCVFVYSMALLQGLPKPQPNITDEQQSQAKAAAKKAKKQRQKAAKQPAQPTQQLNDPSQANSSASYSPPKPFLSPTPPLALTTPVLSEANSSSVIRSVLQLLLESSQTGLWFQQDLWQQKSMSSRAVHLARKHSSQDQMQIQMQMQTLVQSNPLRTRLQMFLHRA